MWTGVVGVVEDVGVAWFFFWGGGASAGFSGVRGLPGATVGLDCVSPGRVSPGLTAFAAVTAVVLLGCRM